MSTEPLTKEACFRILELYRNWNHGQVSVKCAMTGIRTEEDDVLDARRELIAKATKRLTDLTGE